MQEYSLSYGAEAKGEKEDYAESDVIELEDSYVESDYVEIERMKETKAVIVIDQEEIQGKGHKNLEDVLNTVPSINVGLTGWGDIDIRGQGSSQSQRNIQVMLDGAPITTLTSHPLQNNYNYIPVDIIEKIEIIPGGGSVMYGSGASGGVINITSKLKNMKTAGSSLTTKFASNEKGATLNIGGPINKHFNYQLSYSKNNKDLYFKNTWHRNEYLSLGLLYKIDSTQELSLRVSSLDEKGKMVTVLTNKSFEKYGRNYVPEEKWFTVGLDANGNRIRRKISGYADARRELKTYNMSYAKNFNPHTRIILDAFYNDGFFKNNNLGDKEMEHSTKGVKFKGDFQYGPKEKHHVLIGLEAYNQEAKISYNDYKYVSKNKYRINPLHFNYEKDTKAIYASNTLNFGKWSFVQGARIEWNDWKFDKKAANSAGKDVRNSRNHALEAAISYRYNETGNVYFRYERGFTYPDGIQVADDLRRKIQPTVAEDEIFNLFELGVRGRLKWTDFDVTLFYSKTDNQLDRFLIMPKGGGLQRRTLNLYETERRGLEVNFQQKIGKWKFTEGYAYLKGKSEYSNKGRAFLEEAQKRQFLFSSDSLQAVPRNKLFFTAQYSPNRQIDLIARYSYIGSYDNFMEKTNKDENRVKGHRLVDLLASYRFNNDKTVATVGVKNVFDKKYATYQSERQGGYHALLPGDGRTYYFELNHKF